MHGSTLNDGQAPAGVAIGQTWAVRYLTVVRHAKSTPAEPGSSDIERGLSDHGLAQCRQLRAWALDPDALGRYGPVTALVSAAARTRATFERAFEGLSFVTAVEFSARIYNGRREVTAQDLLRDLAAIDPVTSSVLVVAHNPTVLELLLEIAERVPKSLRKGHYPLGGAYVLSLPDDRTVGLERYEILDSFVPD